MNQPVARIVDSQVANGPCLLGPSFISILSAASITRVLAQGHYLAPCVPAVLLPMSVGAVSAGVWIYIQTSHLSKDTGCLSRRDGEEPRFASLRLSLSPGREKLSTPSKTHAGTAASRLLAVTSAGVPQSRPLSGRLKRQYWSLCGRPPSLTYEVCPGRHFLLLFAGGVPRMVVNKMLKNK